MFILRPAAQATSLRLKVVFVAVTLVWLAWSWPCPAAQAQPLKTLTIFGPGVVEEKELTLAEIDALEQYEHIYSGINTYPTKQWYVARGVKVSDLLALAGLQPDATIVRFYSEDGYDVTFTVSQLLGDPRYYFPGLKDNHPADGSIAGSAAGAVKVECILATLSAEGSDDPAHMNSKDALLLVLGQRAVTEQVSALFVKNVNRIEVLTDEPDKWDEPRLNLPQGMVIPAQTELVLSTKDSDADKIYYTTDGSTPTLDSPIYNWSASRWWPLRGDLQQINAPIAVTEDMVLDTDGQKAVVIKAKTVGPGKADSDVVTFRLLFDPEAQDPTRLPGGPPTAVDLDRSAISLAIGGSYRLQAMIEPFNADSTELIWSSSDTTVAVVDNKGLVTVVGSGTAFISAQTATGGLGASCYVVGGNGSDEESQEPSPAVPPEESTPIDESEKGVGDEQDPADQDPPDPASEDDDLPPAEQYDPVSEQRRYLVSLTELEQRPSDGTERRDSDPVAGADGSELFLEGALSPITGPSPPAAALPFFMVLFMFGAGKKYVQHTKES